MFISNDVSVCYVFDRVVVMLPFLICLLWDGTFLFLYCLLRSLICACPFVSVRVCLSICSCFVSVVFCYILVV